MFFTNILLAFGLLQFPETATQIPRAESRPVDLFNNRVERVSALPLPSTARDTRPSTYFDAVGNCSFLCGTENGPIEAWVWPRQILHNGKFTFRPAKSLDAFDLHSYASKITVTPAETAIDYKSADVFARVRYICPFDVPAILLLVELDVDEPGTFIFTFQPKLQPQWPAATGGVAAKYTKEIGGFVISEPSARSAAIVASPWATRATEGMQYLLPNGELRIEMDVAPERCKKEVLPILIVAAEGDGSPRTAEQLYHSLLLKVNETARANELHWQKRIQQITKITTPDPLLDEAFFWNCLSLEQGIVKSAALGDGIVAGYGPAGATSQRPGFAWFFTGDVGVNALAYLGGGMADTLSVGLRFAAKHQRSDGKIPHEVVLSAHLCDWFTKYPFAYIHGETTALWIHAIKQYVDYTGDLELLKELWPSIVKGYEWIVAQDGNGDGLPDNTKAGMGASEIGPLRENLQTDMYLAASAFAAFNDIAQLAKLRNDMSLAAAAYDRAGTAKSSIMFNFWNKEADSYAHSLLTDGKLSLEKSVWPACAVLYGAALGERAEQTMKIINSPELTTDWGVRILSKESKYYEPKGYNSGAVWPFVTGLAALANYQTANADAGYKNIQSIAKLTFAESLGRTPEVLSGNRPRTLDASVPHQLFSSMAVVAPTVQGIFGYYPFADDNRIELKPCFPAGWKEAKIENVQFGMDRLDIFYQRDGDLYHVLVTHRTETAPKISFIPKNGTAGKFQIFGPSKK